jgi:hypothetical protein
MASINLLSRNKRRRGLAEPWVMLNRAFPRGPLSKF